MPVIAVPLISRMQLRLVTGFDDGGNPIMRTRSYNNIKPSATNEAVLLTATELAEFQQHDLETVRRVNEFELEEEE